LIAPPNAAGGGEDRVREKEGAKLRWWIAAEQGFEIAQNNLAYVLDQRRSSFECDTRVINDGLDSTQTRACFPFLRLQAKTTKPLDRPSFNGPGLQLNTMSTRSSKSATIITTALALTTNRRNSSGKKLLVIISVP
jgi:hypothetical protein